MSLLVIEVLKNAKYNLKNGVMPFQKQLAIEQLSNAIKQLEINPDANAEFIENIEGVE
jgi:thiamine pyrophosphokinase